MRAKLAEPNNAGAETSRGAESGRDCLVAHRVARYAQSTRHQHDQAGCGTGRGALAASWKLRSAEALDKFVWLPVLKTGAAPFFI